MAEHSLRFALNHMVAPHLPLAEFFALARRLGLADVEIRNDLAGQPLPEPAEVKRNPPNSPESIGRAAAIAACTSGSSREARCAAASSHTSTTYTVPGSSSVTPTS